MEQPERYPYEVHEGGLKDTFQWLWLKTWQDGFLEMGENIGFLSIAEYPKRRVFFLAYQDTC